MGETYNILLFRVAWSGRNVIYMEGNLVTLPQHKCVGQRKIKTEIFRISE